MESTTMQSYASYGDITGCYWLLEDKSQWELGKK